MARRPAEDPTERWILNTFCLWFFLLCWFSMTYSGDQLAVAAFFLWTAVALIGVLTVWTLVDCCCNKR